MHRQHRIMAFMYITPRDTFFQPPASSHFFFIRTSSLSFALWSPALCSLLPSISDVIIGSLVRSFVLKGLPSNQTPSFLPLSLLRRAAGRKPSHSSPPACCTDTVCRLKSDWWRRAARRSLACKGRTRLQALMTREQGPSSSSCSSHSAH